jgi:hypothetical protein
VPDRPVRATHLLEHDHASRLVELLTEKPVLSKARNPGVRQEAPERNEGERMTRRTVPTGAPLRKASFTLAAALGILCSARAVFGWGHEGPVLVAL